MQKMALCLWYDSQAEEAAKLYTSIFKDSKILSVSRYGKEGFEIHGQKEGTVMLATFVINGMTIMALNGGPIFPQSEAASIVVTVDTQEEIDHLWKKLIENGGQESQCGWLKDKFGVSWQITPRILEDLMTGPDKAKADRVMKAFMKMKKFDIQKLKDA